MDKKEIIKWAAIALAAYLVWRYMQTRGGFSLFDSPGAQPQIQPGTQPQTGTQPSTQAPSAGTPQPSAPQQTQQPAQQTATPSDEDLMAAAYNPAQVGRAGDYRLNLHQWNWYRMQAAIQATGTYTAEQHQPNWDSMVDPNVPVTASEYQALLAQRGLSGRGGWSFGYSAPYRGGTIQ